MTDEGREHRIKSHFTRKGLKLSRYKSVQLISITVNDIVLADPEQDDLRASRLHVTVSKIATHTLIRRAVPFTFSHCQGSSTLVRLSNWDVGLHPCQTKLSGLAPQLAKRLRQDSH
ncbi:hypothetical protein [Mycobacterium uberis]|uniref:hypothetical protein n=1 Tax=Mycobacterium uberis TaxID=2162698 RepID=UPI000E3067E0|nr:hypothetical protein [Mycobacterium uberis]